MAPDAPRPRPTLIYGGTAAYWLDLAEFGAVGETLTPQTPFGPAAPITWLNDRACLTVGFSSRHGVGELQRSAGFVNHRANLWAAQQLGFGAILSWNGVGAINPALTVGDLVAPTDLLDWTSSRRGHSFDRWHQPPAGPPFDPSLRQTILRSLAAVRPANTDAALTHHAADVIYVCTEGPRLETQAEIALFARAGADVVGMTLAPEVWLARELGLRYASLCFVTNYATGMARGREPQREFGPAVARTCLPILLTAAGRLARASQ